MQHAGEPLFVRESCNTATYTLLQKNKYRSLPFSNNIFSLIFYSIFIPLLYCILVDVIYWNLSTWHIRTLRILLKSGRSKYMHILLIYSVQQRFGYFSVPMLLFSKKDTQFVSFKQRTTWSCSLPFKITSCWNYTHELRSSFYLIKLGMSLVEKHGIVLLFQTFCMSR